MKGSILYGSTNWWERARLVLDIGGSHVVMVWPDGHAKCIQRSMVNRHDFYTRKP